MFATLPRGGSPALAQSAVELAQQGMQLRLLLRAEYSEAVGDKRLMRRHDLAKERVAGVGEIEPIGPPILAPLDEPRMLQLILTSNWATLMSHARSISCEAWSTRWKTRISRSQPGTAQPFIAIPHLHRCGS